MPAHAIPFEARVFERELVSATVRRIEAMSDDELSRLRLTADESPDAVVDRLFESRRANDEWDEIVGPFVSAKGVAYWAGYGNKQNVSNAAKRGDLLAVPVGSRKLYPRFQFSGTWQPLPYMREVISILREEMESPWTQALWLNTGVRVGTTSVPVARLDPVDSQSDSFRFMRVSGASSELSSGIAGVADVKLTPAELLHRGESERVLTLARADVERRAH